jgi:hypothetical protein
MIARSLRAITVTMPRAEGFALGFIGLLQALALGGAAVWSIILAWKIAALPPRIICVDSRQLSVPVLLPRRARRAGLCFFGSGNDQADSHFG